MFSLKDIVKSYHDPVLVQSVDGVGTKTVVAQMAGKYENLGRDLFAAVCNDIVVMGAKPLTFLDYIAFNKLSPPLVEALVKGMSEACLESGVALVGGETAEMPDVYLNDEIDIVGLVTGIVEREKIVNGSRIKSGDRVYALNSSGLHTNGFSLARKALFDISRYSINDRPDILNGESIGDSLLAYHINYTDPIQRILNAGIHVKGMAHITGGGVIENIPRILPAGLTVELDVVAWERPPIFSLIKQAGNVNDFEMYRVFNMGVGCVLIGDENIERALKDHYARIPPALSFGQLVMLFLVGRCSC